MAISHHDKNAMRHIQMETNEALAPIKHQVIQADKVLNKKLKNILSKKQYKKWIRYQTDQKESLKPQLPENRSRSNGPPRGRRF